MTSSRIAFRLETRWTPVRDGEPLAYELKLTNTGSEPVSGFRLCVSGPARIDPAATIEGATLTARLSNHSELVPDDGFVLEPGGVWVITVRGLSYPLKHWSDGANTAYLVLTDGSTTPVAVNPTVAIGQNAPLRKGTQKYPVPGPGVAPVVFSVIPWPAKVAVEGRSEVPAGLDPSGQTEAA